MRLAWSGLLGVPLFCSLFGCDPGDNCGPTSEWPKCNNETSGTGGGKGAADPSAPRPSTDDSKRDAGRRPSVNLDAGASTPAKGADDEGEEASSDGDTSTLDAGVFDAGDASAPVDDGGSDEGCLIDSDRRDAGACFGMYCGMPQTEFAKRVDHVGACLGTEDLALACDGELTRAVSDCAQDGVFALGFARALASCAQHKPSLATASTDCVNCYVDEVLCALDNCLAPCLNGAALDCTSCRRAHCSDDFRFCSGLPR
ncbi:MAG TPA: hypothetical protein VI299_19745 [Polyangiales bacterium]